MSEHTSKESGPMDQTDKSEQGQKPKICKLAILSPLAVIFGFWIGVVLLNQRRTRDLGGYIFMLSPLAGLLLAIIAAWRIRRSKGALKGYAFSISGAVLFLSVIVFLILLPSLDPSWIPASRVVCGSFISGLGRSILLYNYDYDGYPTPEIWCDLLIKYEDVPKSCFACPDALKHGDKGPCHYALNPNCSPNSPNDVVLLFETNGGWNQYGGPELLTTKHHKGIGCNICFKDCHVRFIATEQLGELKWDGEFKKE